MNVLLSTCQWIMALYVYYNTKMKVSHQNTPVSITHTIELCRILHAISFSLTTTENHVTFVRSNKIKKKTCPWLHKICWCWRNHKTKLFSEISSFCKIHALIYLWMSCPTEIFNIILRNVSWNAHNATNCSSTLLTLNATNSFFLWETEV